MLVANDIEEFLEYERRLILVERTEHDAEQDLESLIELGEEARAVRICHRILEKAERK